MSDNIKISEEDLQFIRRLDSWDLTMILSEINDHGWKPHGESTLKSMKECAEKGLLKLLP